MRRRICGSSRAVHTRKVLRREDVYCIHIGVHLPPVLNLLNIWPALSIYSIQTSLQRTRDILVENVIFLDHIVYYLLRGVVQDQHFPLKTC
jgi:hypothetical protein